MIYVQFTITSYLYGLRIKIKISDMKTIYKRKSYYWTNTNLDTDLKGLDLFDVFGVGAVGVVQSSLEFADLEFVLLLEAGDLGLHAGLDLDQSALELLDDSLAAASDVLDLLVLLSQSGLHVGAEFVQSGGGGGKFVLSVTERIFGILGDAEVRFVLDCELGWFLILFKRYVITKRNVMRK